MDIYINNSMAYLAPTPNPNLGPTQQNQPPRIQHKETAMLAKYIRGKGARQGIQQGVQKGIIKKAKEDIIEILQLRFGKIPFEITDKINRTNDLEILSIFLKQGVQAKNLDQIEF